MRWVCTLASLVRRRADLQQPCDDDARRLLEDAGVLLLGHWQAAAGTCFVFRLLVVTILLEEKGILGNLGPYTISWHLFLIS